MTLNLAAHDNAKLKKNSFNGGGLKGANCRKMQKKAVSTPQKGKFKLD